MRTSGGVLLLIAGIPMLVMPGPGMPIIFFGLNLLAVDYPWAKRVLGRMRGALDELQRRLPRRAGMARARSAASGLSRRLGRRRPQLRPQPAPTPSAGSVASAEPVLAPGPHDGA